MEFLNRIEIRGVVGNVAIQRVGDGAIARLSVVTEEAHTNRNGEHVIECTWHQVTIWSTPDEQECLRQIITGDRIHVEGRLRCNKYQDAAGVTHPYADILASKWNIEK